MEQQLRLEYSRALTDLDPERIVPLPVVGARMAERFGPPPG